MTDCEEMGALALWTEPLPPAYHMIGRGVTSIHSKDRRLIRG
jgi:hypothetical protein